MHLIIELVLYLSVFFSDFANNFFTFGDGADNLGSKVTLVADVFSHECEIFPDGSHERQVMCYTEYGLLTFFFNSYNSYQVISLQVVNLSWYYFQEYCLQIFSLNLLLNC